MDSQGLMGGYANIYNIAGKELGTPHFFILKTHNQDIRGYFHKLVLHALCTQSVGEWGLISEQVTNILLEHLYKETGFHTL